MRTVWVEAGAIAIVAAAMLVSVTTLALRRTDARRSRPARSRHTHGPAAGARGEVGLARAMLAALPSWGGVLVTLVLLARGKLALAALAALTTIVHAGILRWRASLPAGPR